MNKLTQYQKGWLSGIIDGEGCISLIKEKRLYFKVGYTYKARFNVGNTDLKLVKETQKIIGGGCIVKASKRFREDIRHKPFWNLDVSANIIRDIFPQIKLIIKDEQRKLLLRALKILERHCGRSLPPRTNKEIKDLEKIYQKIRELNK